MITVNTLQKMKTEGEKIAMLTCYEASFASLMEAAGVDVLLVGVQNWPSTWKTPNCRLSK